LKTFIISLALATAALSLAACESARESDPRTDVQLVQLATVQSAGLAVRAFTGVVAARVHEIWAFEFPVKSSSVW
jgi:hypothetical protein